MKLYHFLEEKWALEALKKQRLKVSRFNDVNDPFELMAMSLEDKVSRSILKDVKNILNEKLRLLSCSLNWSSPLLWGHYANKHKGIALILEVPSSNAAEVVYSKDRTKIDLQKLMTRNDESAKQELFKMFTTKYEQWSYEQEYRIQIEAKDVFKVDDLDFYKCDEDLKIVGIVLGPLNTTPIKEIRNALPQGEKVKVITTRVAFKSFNVVHQKKKPPFEVRGEG